MKSPGNNFQQNIPTAPQKLVRAFEFEKLHLQRAGLGRNNHKLFQSLFNFCHVLPDLSELYPLWRGQISKSYRILIITNNTNHRRICWKHYFQICTLEVVRYLVAIKMVLGILRSFEHKWRLVLHNEKRPDAKSKACFLKFRQWLFWLLEMCGAMFTLEELVKL